MHNSPITLLQEDAFVFFLSFWLESFVNIQFFSSILLKVPLQSLSKYHWDIIFVFYRTYKSPLHWILVTLELLNKTVFSYVFCSTLTWLLSKLNVPLNLFLGKCRQRTIKGHCCVFPFVYRGRRQYTCSKRGSRRPWCPIVPGYRRGKAWGYCRGRRCKNAYQIQFTLSDVMMCPLL